MESLQCGDDGTPRSITQTTRGPSAKAMLFTVLGEFLRHPDSAAWTGSLVAALGELGFAEHAARRALSRAASEGWVTPSRHGRKIRWSPSAAAVAHFAEAAEDIYRRRRHIEAWDGQWLVLTTSVPEARRAQRHQLRTRLRWAGFGPLGQGVWVSPRPFSRERIRPLLEELGLGVNAVSFVGSIGPVGSEYGVVRGAWDLSGLARDYQDFVEQLASAPIEGTGREIFVRLTHAVHRWRAFALRDPYLPGELLPSGWVGNQARAAFYERHDRWLPVAQAWLQHLDRDAGNSRDHI